MIDRIEFHTLPPHGITITFFYDSDCMDTFAMFERGQIDRIMELVQTDPEPEAVLIAIRDYGCFSIH